MTAAIPFDYAAGVERRVGMAFIYCVCPRCHRYYNGAVFLCCPTCQGDEKRS